MDRILRTVLMLLTITTSSALPAYPTPVDFDGTVLRWNIDADAPEVTYQLVNEAGVDSFYEELVAQAADKWTEVPTSYFTWTQVSSGGADVTVRLKSALSGSPYSAGFAVFDEKVDGEVRHCTAEILASTGTSYLSFAKTTLHEMGHCLGLGHSTVPGSIMSYELEKNDFDLDTDDIAAVSRLYPVDSSARRLPPGCAVAGTGSFPPGLLLLLPLFPAVFLLRKDYG